MESTYKNLPLDNFYIVGIGASAGGLEAIIEFFDNVPAQVECAFIVVQHLSPDYKSLMPELLSKHTDIPIFVAEDNMFVKPGNIYLIPHRKNMTIEFGKLKLRDKDLTMTPNMTIDIFLKSLAAYKKQKAIGVILSGTGSDGSHGIAAIKKEGGFTLVQDPLTAKFDGMPNSATNTGLADLVIAPELMPEEILNYIHEGLFIPQDVPEKYDEQLLGEILLMIKDKAFRDFTSYKRPTLIRRIAKRMGFKKFQDIRSYKEFLQENPEELVELSKEFLIGVTRFFRDETVFEYLSKKIIPEIIEKNKAAAPEPVKVWIAGCSTGEEAYSIAILFREHLIQNGKNTEVKIFATDVDKNAIDFASRGIYSERQITDVSSERLNQFFEKAADGYKVAPVIRKMIIFAPHDLTRDAPFSRMDMVSCRNMLIYLEPAMQSKIFSKFHFSLNFAGYLVLGPSENIGDFSGIFEEVNKKFKIFRNASEEKKPSFDSFQLVNPTIKNIPERPLQGTKYLNPPQIHELLNESLLSLTGYAAIITNEMYDLVYCAGDYKKFVRLPEKSLDLNLLRMVPEELSILLGTTIRKAVKNKSKVIMNNSLIRENNLTRVIDIVVEYQSNLGKGKNSILVLLKEKRVEENEAPESSLTNGEETSELFELRHELKETKENMQSLIEELETGNEEIQSSNEELVSANEELQSTNEELQSLNEELHTVNAEYQQKIKELIELNDDLNNYFRSTDIGQVFVDRNFIIRKFTPAVKQQINLIEKDIGRPISHISNNIKHAGLMDDIRKVQEESVTIEREVQAQDGRWYQLRILPYLRHDKKNDGVIIAFVDINNLKRLNEHFSAILGGSLSGIMTFTSVLDEKDNVQDFLCTLVNPSAQKLTGKEENQLIGKRLSELKLSNNMEALADKYKHVVRTGEYLHAEHYYEVDGRHGWVEVVAVKMTEGFALTFQDISDKKLGQDKIRTAYNNLKIAQENLKKLNNELESRVSERTRELSLSEERFRLLSLATNDAIWDWDFVSKKVWWNEGFKEIFGYSMDNSTDQGIEFLFSKIHPDDKDRVMKGIQEVITMGKETWSGEYRLLKADETYAYILDRAYVLRYKENGMPYRMIGSMVNLTNLKNAQTQLQKTNENLRKINNDLDNFIYTASHDLKAPISNIEGLVHTLEELLLDTYQGEVSDIIEMIKISIEKFKDTIKDLTEIAKIQKEHAEDLECISLTEVIEEIKISIKDMFVKSDATLDCNFEEPEVLFSKKNLRSILYNLISNAIKYKAPDRAPVIKISSRKAGEYTFLQITDNGLGIPKDKQAQVFGMFKRFHSHVEGTGIGLYIVRRMIENAGGRIEMESELGKGTRFNIYLPEGTHHRGKHKENSSLNK